jgi:hypothetical protein
MATRYSKNDLEKSIEALSRGTSLRKVSRDYGIARTTIIRYITKLKWLL